MPFPGEPIPLVVTLRDGEINRFIKAILKDEFDVEISGSPVTLVHTGNGTYSDFSVSMTTAKYVYATYIPFMNAGLTVPDGKYGQENAVFEKDITATIPGTVIITPVNLQGKLGSDSVSSSLGAREVKRSIGTDEVSGKIEKQEIETKVTQAEIRSKLTASAIDSELGCRKGG
jgi:hypothetical protein